MVSCRASQAGYDSFQIIEIPINFEKIKNTTRSFGDNDLLARTKSFYIVGIPALEMTTVTLGEYIRVRQIAN